MNMEELADTLIRHRGLPAAVVEQIDRYLVQKVRELEDFNIELLADIGPSVQYITDEGDLIEKPVDVEYFRILPSRMAEVRFATFSDHSALLISVTVRRVM